MPLNWGTVTGLAQSGQFDQKIADLRFNEEMNRRALAQNEAKAKMFADSMEFQNAMNSHDNPLIKEFARNKQYEVGQFVRNNPDWSYNVEKRIQLNQMLRELKDNPDLNRGMASDASYREYLKDMQEVAKNPERHNTAAYDNVNSQWNNYIKYGNQDGEEAAKREGKKAFLYTKPRDFVDINKRFEDIGNSFKDMRTRPIKGGRNAYEEYANPESLRLVAYQEYLQNKDQYDIEAGRKGIDPLQYIEGGINAHVPKKRDFGDYGLSDAMTLAKMKRGWELDDMQVPPNQSAFQAAFVNKDAGVVSPEVLEQTYGPKPKNIIYSNNGQQQIDNTGNRLYYTGAHKWIQTADRNGNPQRQKVVEVYSYLTPEQAKEKGIYDDGAWNPFQGEEISPDWNKQAEIVKDTNAKGDEVKMIKVKSLLPVELNESYAGAFDNQVHFSKSKLVAQTPNEAGSNVPAGTVNEWRQAGWSDAQIQQGVQQGAIRVKQ